MSSRRCPRCNRVYADPARFCPQDGSPLVEVSGTAAAAPKPPAAGAANPMQQTSAGLRTLVRQAALKRLKEKRDFWGHLSVYVIVNAILIAIWAMSGAGPFGEIPAVPTVVVLDRFGKLVWKHTGLAKADEIRAHVRNL